MRFFTRDLYRRCRSSDEAVLDVACEEWEAANEAYERHLKALTSEFPPSVRQLASLLLHDAKVQAIARQDALLILVLQKEIPPRELIILCYDLDDEPIIEPFAETPRDWTQPTTFDFDELDIVKDAKGTRYLQSLVFGNGWLMRLPFHDVGMSVAQTMYPTSIPGIPLGVAVPQSA